MVTQEKLGIDGRINKAFEPISNFWEGLILISQMKYYNGCMRN